MLTLSCIAGLPGSTDAWRACSAWPCPRTRNCARAERLAWSRLPTASAPLPLAGLPVIPLYARVDGVITGTGVFCLIELEVNEPDLYFDYAPEHAACFAEAIHAKVAGR